MRCPRTLLSLLGAALLFLSGCKKDFKPFDIPQTRATVSLPGHPTARQEHVPDDGTVTVYSHEDQNGSYLVSAYPIPKRAGDGGARPEREHLLSEAGKAIKTHFQVPDDKWSPVDLPGNRLGIEVSFEIPDHGQQAALPPLSCRRHALYPNNSGYLEVGGFPGEQDLPEFPGDQANL